MTTIAVVTTTDSIEEARTIASALVERGLAACVQLSGIESVYTWQGATQKDDEFRVLAKTTDDRYPDVEAAILALHSYDLPAIYAVELSFVHGPYAEWVEENSRPG